MSDIKKIKDDYLVKINNNHNLDNLNQIKSELFGKNGIIALEFKKISSISANEKKQFASNLNLIKDELNQKYPQVNFVVYDTSSGDINKIVVKRE